MEYLYHSKSEQNTKNIAFEIGKRLKSGHVVTLSGDLGAGKTTFTKGLAVGLGIDKVVSSPTFTIMKEYIGTVYPLYHIDAYRLENSEEDIGLDEYIQTDGIAVIEWPNYIQDYLPDERLEIEISYKNDTARMISTRAIGIKYEKIIKSLNLTKGTSI